MKFYGLTDAGLVRKNNQDCYRLKRCDSAKALVAVLCDGVGGANAGEVASALATDCFVEHVAARLSSRTGKKPEPERVLRAACLEANTSVYEYSCFDFSFRGMGTTLVGGIVYDSGRLVLANIGDSRAYLISRQKKTIEQLTKDHSLVFEMYLKGFLTKEEARTHPKSNIITRAIGSSEFEDCDIYEFQLEKGDVLILCSDGLSDYVPDEAILSSVLQSEDESICLNLLGRSYAGGAGDNVTVVAVVNE